MRKIAPAHATAAALLGDFYRPGGIATSQADRVAGAEDAARPAQLIESFAVTGPQAITTARRLGPVVVDYFGRAMLALEEVVSIGILDATVHLLDLQRALGLPPTVPAAGIEHTVGLLAHMTPPVDFIGVARVAARSRCSPSCAKDGSQNRRANRSRRGRPSGSTTSR
jgi:hypothetical protein